MVFFFSLQRTGPFASNNKAATVYVVRHDGFTKTSFCYFKINPRAFIKWKKCFVFSKKNCIGAGQGSRQPPTPPEPLICSPRRRPAPPAGRRPRSTPDPAAGELPKPSPPALPPPELRPDPERRRSIWRWRRSSPTGVTGVEVESGMVKWAVDDPTCREAMLSKEYKCLSAHSRCLEVTDDRTSKHVGYR